jgi:hypothetical protein
MPDIPLDALLSFLKDTRGLVNWSEKDLRNCLKLDSKQAQQVLAILEMQGYVAREPKKTEENDAWLTTSAGETISGSKKPQFSSHSVDEALNAFAERIEAVNRDKRSEFKITQAVAFGDFLARPAQAQAADVGVELSRRNLRSNSDLRPDSSDDLQEKRRAFMAGLRRKSRLLSVHTFRPWMSQRSHRRLL